MPENYQKKFVRQREELRNHFEEGYKRLIVPRNLLGVAEGVRDYIKDHKYFELTPEERKAISENPDFDASAADEIEIRAQKQAIDEVIRMCRERRDSVNQP